MKLSRFLTIALLLALAAGIHAQQYGSLQSSHYAGTARYDDEEEEFEWKGFGIGLSIGMYFASKHTANVYNGTCGAGYFQNPDEVQCYTIAQRLGIDPVNQFFIQTYQQVTNYYNATGMNLNFDSYPANMRYNPAMYVGFQLRYNFNRDAAFVLNSNTVGLKTVDVFTVTFQGTTAQQNAQTDTRPFQIVGKENRVNVNLGYRQGFEAGPRSNTYLQFGGSFLGTRYKSNEIFIANQVYDLYTGVLNNQQITNMRPRTNYGLGWYAAAGLEFFINEQFSFDLSINWSRDKVILIDYSKRVSNWFLQASFGI